MEIVVAMQTPSAARSSRRPYVVAVVLGTALTAGLAPQPVQAADSAPRAVADLSRYCSVCWRNARLSPDCWNDCTQEVFRRLLERVPTAQWGAVLKSEGEDRREFLRAIDAVKKRTQRGRKWAPGSVETAADPRGVNDRTRAEDREAIRHAAREVLSERQQRILQLSFDGWSVQEISDEMRLPADRVSDEKYKAVRKLRGKLATEAPTARTRVGA